MTSYRLAYDDASTPHEMFADCQAVGANLHLPARETRAERVRSAVVGQAPSIHFADYPREVHKPEITVTDAAARLANALHLHLD